ncbi:hypothetical protein WDW37_08885 [Bdellovibrionota bacterium FG-1]
MAHWADLHNFGQQVKRFARASGTFYQKPRTLFWEWLFFGTTSPLHAYLDRLDVPNLTGWYGLEIESMGPDFCGEAREVIDDPAGVADNEAALENFGALLGYCYAFGIRDLHRFNLVRGPNGLQVIDAEVVFTRLLLPKETLLLPFKDTPFSECGLSLLLDSEDQLTTSRVQAILRGYCESLTLLGTHAPELLEIIERELSQAPEIPVRHILRDTRRYFEWEKRKTEEEYLPEELAQLERGDIPYFFKFLGRPELWFYTSPKGDRDPVTVPAKLWDGVERDASPAGILLDRKRLLSQLLPVGVLYLARTLLPKDWVGNLPLGRDQALGCTENRLELSVGPLRFGSARHRGTPQS